MADLNNVKLQIAGFGYVFEAPVDTEPLDLAKFEFGNESTYGTWNWIGDTSSENMIEFSSEGGESESKRTWARLDVRTLTSPESVSATINSVNLHNETFKLAFPNSHTNGNRTDVGSTGGASSRALLIVTQDPDTGSYAAIWFPHTSIKGSFPSLSLEEFTEIPLSVSVLSSLKHTVPGGGGFTKWSYIEPTADRKPADPGAAA